MDTVLASARASQREEESLASALRRSEQAPSLRENTTATPAAVRAWLQRLRVRRGSDGRKVANALQFRALEQVAARVTLELEGAAHNECDFGEPFRWLLHGGLGTGKSHVIKLVTELFEDVLALPGGRLPGPDGATAWWGHDPSYVWSRFQKGRDLAKRVMQWRWLIIVEVNMVSARLFADMDVRLRDVVRDLDLQRRGLDSVTRPFGGLNVLC